jgi:hypothetical protein
VLFRAGRAPFRHIGRLPRRLQRGFEVRDALREASAVVKELGMGGHVPAHDA